MEKQYKLNDRVSKDALNSPTFKKWLKRILCAVCIISLALQLTLCFIPMHASAQEVDSVVGVWVIKEDLSFSSDININLYFQDSVDFIRVSVIGDSTSDSLVVSYDLESNGSYIPLIRYTFYTNYNSTVAFGGYDYIYREFINPSAVNDWISKFGDNGISMRSFDIPSGYTSDLSSSELYSLLSVIAVKEGANYDFVGEYRLFNEQLTNLSFSQAGTVTQSYAFDFNIWGGYNADYFHVQADGSSVDISYAFTDEGSGGIKTVYRQLLRDGEIVGTWLVPRARLIYFQSNPEDPTFQQWLLDNTVLIDESMIESVYSFGYDNGYNDGWTNSAIGDTLKAPVEALNNIVLLDIAGVTITLGGVIFTMVVLSIMLIFLKKYAGG